MTLLSRRKARHAADGRIRWRLGMPRSFAGLMVYMLLLALISGFGSVYWMIRDAYPLGREDAGSWFYWPDTGSGGIDPYALAMVTRNARLPLGASEGLELVATRDTDGAPLRSSCTYRLGPAVPQARFWTLTLFNTRDGRPIRTALGRSGFTSSEVIRDEDGTFSIVLSRQPQAGNWLQLPEPESFLMVLRLYDVPATSDKTMIDPSLAPLVERVECAS